MEKNEILNLIYQHLKEKNLENVCDVFKKESKIEPEPQVLTKIKAKISSGNYDNAVKIIENSLSQREKKILIPQIRLYQIKELIKKNNNKSHTLKLIRKFSENSYDEHNLISKTICHLFSNNNTKSFEEDDLFINCSSLDKLFGFINNILATSSNEKYKVLNQGSLTNIIIELSNFQINNCKYHNVHEKKFSLIKEHKCDKSLLPNKLVLSLSDDNEEIIKLSLSENGKIIATLGKKNNIKLYQINYVDKIIEIKLINTINGIYQNQVTSMQIWNNDTVLTSVNCGKDSYIGFYDIHTKENIKRDFPNEAIVYSCLFFDDKDKENFIVSTQSKKIFVFSSVNFEIQEKVEKTIAIINQICYSKQNKVFIFASFSLNAILLFDKDISVELHRFSNLNNSILSMDLSMNGDYLLVNSSCVTPVLILYKISLKKEVARYFGHRQNGLYHQCRFCGAQENFVCCGGNRKIYIWNRNISIPVSELELHSGSVNDIIWRSDMKDVMFSCSNDGFFNVIGNCYVKDGIKINLPSSQSYSQSLSVSGGPVLALADFDDILSVESFNTLEEEEEEEEEEKSELEDASFI